MMKRCLDEMEQARSKEPYINEKDEKSAKNVSGEKMIIIGKTTKCLSQKQKA